MPATDRIEMARATEAAAMAADVRIQNSDGGTFSAATSFKSIANSKGFAGSYRKSYCGIAAMPIAQDAGGMQRDYWSSQRPHAPQARIARRGWTRSSQALHSTAGSATRPHTTRHHDL